MKRIALATAAAGVLAIPATASAHVTVQPKTAAAGAYTVESVRVPNETDDAVTNKIVVQFPEGFAEVSYQSIPGWTAKVTKERLATPVRTDDGEVTEGVKTITWTSGAKTSGIKPGQFQDFPLSVQIPGRAGDTLTFKALQYYSDGSVARWIGPPDADKPAPQVQVTAAAGTTGTATTGTSASDDREHVGAGRRRVVVLGRLLGLVQDAGDHRADRRRARPRRRRRGPGRLTPQRLVRSSPAHVPRRTTVAARVRPSVPFRKIVMSEPTTPNKRERREAARADRQARENAAAAAETRRKRLLTLGGLLCAAVVVVIVAIVVSSSGGKRRTPSASSGGGVVGVADAKAMLDGIPQKGITLGRADAPVTIVEFADPQCPYCKEYTLNEMPKVVQDQVRTGKAKMELRLLTFIGSDSITAAQVINAAGNQNLLWNTADLMYRNQGEENSGYVTDSFLNGIVKGAGGDAAKAQKDATTPAVQEMIAAAKTLSGRYNVTGTPTVLVGPTGGDLRIDDESAPTAAGIARLVDAAAAKGGT
jgi:uncharacterized protein YcnI/protein-disulfide isomerase